MQVLRVCESDVGSTIGNILLFHAGRVYWGSRYDKQAGEKDRMFRFASPL